LAINIVHFRDNEGYFDGWYDYIGEEGEDNTGYIYYTANVPSGVQVYSDDYLYFTVETYYGNIIPKECTTGYF